MKYTELKNKLKTEINNVYLITGEDRYLCFDALKKIEDALNLSIKDMNMVTISETSAVKDIVASASIYPFGDAYRLVIIKNYVPPKSKEERQELENYLANPMPTTVLVFFSPDLADAYKSLTNITLIDCNKIESKFVAAYINNYFQKQEIVADADAVNLLILFTGGDMTRVTGECEKLSAFALESKVLTKSMVENFVAKDEEYEVYQLADYLAKGDAKKTFDLLESFLVKPGSVYTLMSPLYNTYRRALFVSINKDKTPAELATLFGIKEYAVRMLKLQADKFSPKKLKRIVDMLAEYDKKIKTGEMKDSVAIKTVASNILYIRGNND